ncbi:unnamed protein product [Macrosiphum euphorbiae]|uniref:HAT C-terminal dimerisation domain-containing protein n=3 Tax=Macrosiphum euphorbiae TaxID=13131 RepID=A0AAV0VU93_9HEMI|nr:unnamed protein product [Macrosiphum euphorbiae]CAI6347175.1 unnamed protein product [Macrosiphum euphorbiae]CAI6348869.1 unnamed protein product [Macrosiphum euphorbiae]CAI6360060.1 unnamed protein product [Macrosiphum euphorbiae]CAI6361291.1 unnamed protein product [Macrosiphum euphorbiae]
MNENETKKRIRNCVFNDEWLKDQIFSDWIAKHNNPNKARCILCQTVFSVKYDGVKAVKTHQESKKHEESVNSINKSSTIKKFFPTKNDKDEDKIAAVELSKCFHVVKHHHSYLSSDCGVKLESKHFSDSTIANKVHLGRTKMEAIVKNVLCPFAIEKAVIKLKCPTPIPFSISTDASNKGNRKFFPLAVRLFNFEDGVKDYLLDFYEEPNESSQSIFDTITSAIESLGLDIKNITAFGADNASVNYGKHCSVFEKLKNKKSNIIKANCNCHVIHNAAKHSMKVIKYDVETLVLKVFNEFSMSSKRVDELKECFEFVQQDYHNVLRHIPVRWLSLFNAVDRLILNWNAIKTYFIKKGKNECDKIIWTFIEDQKNELSEQLTLRECYIWFVHHVLSIFQKHILILEKNNLNAPEVYDVMLSLRSQILNRKNDNFFGIAVTTRLPNLTSKENDAFKSDALHTYKRALEYLEKWFDYENSPFKMFSCLKLSELPKLTDLLDLAKLIKVHVNGDELYEELNLIKLLPNDILNNTEFTSSEKWVKFFQSSTAQLKNIKQIVQYVFSVPCSNAFVERVFSHMNSLWTDERNRLGIDTVKAELVIRNNITYNCSEFFDQIQNEKHLLNAVKNAAKYKFKSLQ